MYTLLKFAHIATAALSIGGFCLRGYWMMAGSDLLTHRVTRIAPHIIDTLFLLSGIGLLVVLSLNPLNQPWLLAKFAGLVAYIVLGTLALKRGRTKAIRVGTFVAAVAMFVFLVGVARMHSPAGWFALL